MPGGRRPRERAGGPWSGPSADPAPRDGVPRPARPWAGRWAR